MCGMVIPVAPPSMLLADVDNLHLGSDASMPILWSHPLLEKRRNKAKSPDPRYPRAGVLNIGNIVPCREDPCHVCEKALCPRCDVHEENIIRECNGSCLPHTNMICDECRLEECICKCKWEDMTVEDMLRGNKYPVLCAECVQVRAEEAHLMRYIGEQCLLGSQAHDSLASCAWPNSRFRFGGS
jgi:hypothetical protein